jgi:mono/diheme cytochrome c family protein
MKRILKWVGGLTFSILIVAAVFAAFEVRAFNASMAKVYTVPVPAFTRSTAPAALARGKHVAESLAGCAASDCHGADLAGGRSIPFGPVGTVTGPNVTPAGRAGAYSDGELVRLILHGIKRDGRSVMFMPSADFNWLPDEDIQAVVSYVRTVPPVTKPDGLLDVGLIGKVLDRRGLLDLDVARHIDHDHRTTAPAPAATAAYGAFVSRLCVGCHGEHLSGGPIPGAPSSIPIPANITTHDSGIKGWTFVDFERLLNEGIKKDGKKLNPFMPVETFGKMNDVERKALWAYLESVPPKPFGGR